MIGKIITILASSCYALVLVSCSEIPERKRVELHCQSNLLSAEKIACYKAKIQEKITQRISIATRHLSPSDWPFEYLIRIDVQLKASGEIVEVNLLQVSTSRQLNTTILQSIQRIQQFVVPENEIFNDGGFSRLRLLIKPGRTPILGAEKKIEDDIMIIYLPGACATRSQQC